MERTVGWDLRLALLLGISLMWPLPASAEFQTGNSVYEDCQRGGPACMSYAVGVDGVSLAMVLLTTLIRPICLLASMSKTDCVKAYFA